MMSAKYGRLRQQYKKREPDLAGFQAGREMEISKKGINTPGEDKFCPEVTYRGIR